MMKKPPARLENKDLLKLNPKIPKNVVEMKRLKERKPLMIEEKTRLENIDEEEEEEKFFD